MEYCQLALEPHSTLSWNPKVPKKGTFLKAWHIEDFIRRNKALYNQLLLENGEVLPLKHSQFFATSKDIDILNCVSSLS